MFLFSSPFTFLNSFLLIPLLPALASFLLAYPPPSYHTSLSTFLLPHYLSPSLFLIISLFITLPAPSSRPLLLILIPLHISHFSFLPLTKLVHVLFGKNFCLGEVKGGVPYLMCSVFSAMYSVQYDLCSVIAVIAVSTVWSLKYLYIVLYYLIKTVVWSVDSNFKWTDQTVEVPGDGVHPAGHREGLPHLWGG